MRACHSPVLPGPAFARYAGPPKISGESTSCRATKGEAWAWIASKRWLARKPGMDSSRCWWAAYQASHSARRAASSSAISTM